jgi:hypothetical protein
VVRVGRTIPQHLLDGMMAGAPPAKLMAQIATISSSVNAGCIIHLIHHANRTSSPPHKITSPYIWRG